MQKRGGDRHLALSMHGCFRVSAIIVCDNPLSNSLQCRQDPTPAAAVGRSWSSLYFGGSREGRCDMSATFEFIHNINLLFPFSVVLKGNVITIPCKKKA
jgi:hypothetical protein